MDALKLANAMLFLSTLSLRRATSPPDFCYLDNIISIHALLAESDAVQIVIVIMDALFLSTLSLRRATTYLDNKPTQRAISIHALLAESDSKSAQNSGALLRI